MSDVCAVYDKENETLQIIESSWDEVVCMLECSGTYVVFGKDW